MKKLTSFFLLPSLCFWGLAHAEVNVPSLFLHVYGKDPQSLFHTNERNLAFGANYNLVESNLYANKKLEIDSFELESKPFIFDKGGIFLQHRKLFLGLSYEYRQNGSQDVSFLTKSKDVYKNYLTVNVTPKEISAVVRFNF